MSPAPLQPSPVVPHTPSHSRAPAPSRLAMRRAHFQDMPRVGEIIRSSADWYRSFTTPEDMYCHEAGESWQRENYPRREFYLGDLDGESAATLSLQDFGQDLYLGYVFLDTAFVGKGLGRELLDFAVREARLRDKEGLVLLAHPAADWAVRAYRKYGFERIARSREEILTWNRGAMREFYEEGFELYRYQV